MYESVSGHTVLPEPTGDQPARSEFVTPDGGRRKWLRSSCAAAWGVVCQAQALAHAPALMLAQAIKPSDPPPDLSRYLVSEKLDGVRAYWDGQAMWFRSGASLALPSGWLEHLPRVALDGELWLGRGQFETLSGLLRRAAAPLDAQWRDVRYMVFELPGANGGFAQRNAALQRLFAGRPPAAPIQLVEQTTLSEQAALDQWLEAVVAAGGEGLMLHRRDALYAPGRSDALLKLKPFSDGDATVIAHLPGKGRNTGRLGALQVRTPEGQVFALGSGFTDAQRQRPPVVGSEVVYRHQGRTRQGVPRFATFWRERGP